MIIIYDIIIYDSINLSEVPCFHSFKDKHRTLGLCTLQYYVTFCVAPDSFVAVCFGLMDIESKGVLQFKSDRSATALCIW